jgi:hypothetical protein
VELKIEAKRGLGSRRLVTVIATSRDFAAGAGDFLEKGLEFGGVLLARAGFDATGHIYSIGPDDANCLPHVFRRKTAGEDNAVGLRDAAGEMPIAGGASAAIVAGNGGIQKKGGGAAVAGKVGSNTSLPQAQGFDDR